MAPSKPTHQLEHRIVATTGSAKEVTAMIQMYTTRNAWYQNHRFVPLHQHQHAIDLDFTNIPFARLIAGAWGGG